MKSWLRRVNWWVKSVETILIIFEEKRLFYIFFLQDHYEKREDLGDCLVKVRESAFLFVLSIPCICPFSHGVSSYFIGCYVVSSFFIGSHVVSSFFIGSYVTSLCLIGSHLVPLCFTGSFVSTCFNGSHFVSSLSLALMLHPCV